MGNFTVRTEIAASADQVWKVLADIGDVAAWNPPVARSWVSTDQDRGVGAGRVCEFKGVGRVDEVVTHWEEGRAVTFDITPSGIPGLRHSEAVFVVEPAGDGTAVTCDYTFEAKGGRIVEKGLGSGMKLGIRGLVEGLRKHVEAEA